MRTEKEKRAERWQRWYARTKNDPVWQAKRKAAKQRDYTQRRTVVLAKNKEWAKANRSKVSAIWRRFYNAHAESERQRSKNKSPEQRRETQRRYARAHPLVFAAKEGRRRARKRATTVGDVDYSAVIRDSGGLCGICGEVVNSGPVHIDHIVPLARGGSHTQDNLQFTHGRCNNVKGAKLLQKVAG